MRRSIVSAALGLAMLLPCSSTMPAVIAGQRGGPAPGVRLRDVAAAAGIDFVHQHSPSADKHYVESTPGGVAVFDYNGDRRPDLFFTNGAETPSLKKTSSSYANRLYRNDGNMRFSDVTEQAGAGGRGYAMGAAAADFDNDGHVDLFVAGAREQQLLRNRGDGRFEDVTHRAGIADGEWAAAAGWFDYDGDGRLDLLVANYVKWSPDAGRYCGDQARGIRIYCHPRYFEGLPNRLYRNRGDGTFEDVSARAGIAAHVGKGMSVAFADFDHDGRLDAFVTNDAVPSFLFRNAGDGTFTEVGLLAGVAVPVSGRAVSAMGADFQDYDNDGWEDLHVTALSGETFPLFRNDRRGAFEETTRTSGLAKETTHRAGWCTIFADVDNDGRKDIFTANSHVNDRVGDFESTAWKQANSLFLNLGGGRFADAGAGAGLDKAAVHRGCGVADFDGDGRLDIVVLVLGSRAELWRNETVPPQHWIRLRLAGTRSNRDGIGARVVLGDQVRTFSTAVGYASSSHAGVHFGLGASGAPVRVEVHWPSGTRQVLEGVTVDRVVEVTEP